jgi:hypothetical protein
MPDLTTLGADNSGELRVRRRLTGDQDMTVWIGGGGNA